MKKKLATAFLIVFIICGNSWGNTPGINTQAKIDGITLFNQYRNSYSQLKIAAESGDPEAQYYLAEEIRHTNKFATAEAINWYEKSAEQGDIYSMIRLGRMGEDLCTIMKNCQKTSKNSRYWLAKAHATALPKAESGDVESMFLMYNITTDYDWLEKSAKGGYGLANFWMGIAVRQGRGFYLLPSQRQDSVEQWMKASAEGGYPKGVMYYAAILAEKGEVDQSRIWLIKAADTGDAISTYNYAMHSSEDNNKFGVSVDRIRAYGLML
jgi:TPR repeat protein